jgi:hypothetical protein
MSENLDLVRSISAPLGAATSARPGGQTPRSSWSSPTGLYPGSSSGLPAFSERYRDWLSTWEDVRFEATECRELDDQRVLVLGHYFGRGKTSGLELGRLPSRVAALFHVRGRKVTRLVLYADPEHALADLDLAPESGSS